MKFFRLLSVLAVLALLVPRAEAQDAVAAPAAAVEGLHLVPPIGHTAEVNSVVFTPDGRYVLTGSSDQTAVLWEAATGREVMRLAGHAVYVLSVAVSPDGRYALTGAFDKTPRLWDLTTGQQVRQFVGHEGVINCVAFSRDGRYAVTGSSDMTVRVWDVATGQEKRRFLGHTHYVNGVAFSPDNRYVLSGGGWRDNSVRLWDIAANTLAASFVEPNGIINAVAFSPDGKLAASASESGIARLFEVSPWREVRAFTGHTGGVRSVAFRIDGRLLVTGSYDKSVKVWDTNTGALLRTFTGHTGGVQSAVFRPDGKTIVSASQDHTVRTWDVESGQEVGRFAGHTTGRVASLTFSPDGRYLLRGGWHGDNTATLWDLSAGRPARTFGGHSQAIQTANFSRDGSQLVTASADATTLLWDATSGRQLRAFPGYGGVLSADGKLVIGDDAGPTQVEKNAAILWDATTGRELRRFGGHFFDVDAVGLSPDGKMALTAETGKIHLWDALTGQALKVLQSNTATTKGVGFSADGKLVVAGPEIWDALTGAKLRTLAPPAGTTLGTFEKWFNCAIFSPDGKWVATGGAGSDKIVRLWDTATGREVRRFTGHTDDINAIAFNPAMTVMATGANDDTIRLWDPATGRHLATLLTLDGNDWLAYTPDGRFDGSPGGIRKCHFVRGLQTFAVEQFAERFYTPDLLSAVLGGEKALPQTAEQSVLAGEPPLVHIASPATGTAAGEQVEVAVEATEKSGGGIKGIRLYHNGRLVGGPGSLRGIVVEAATAPAPATPAGALTKKFSVTLAPGVNVLRAVAYSRTDVESAPDEVALQWSKPEPVKPVLHVLAVGINKYLEPGLTLEFARPDAEAVAAFFKGAAQGSGLFREADVVSLFDADATGSAILAALNKMADQSKPEDVVFLYLAGHGTAVSLPADPASQIFYFLPQDVKSATDADLVRAGGVSGQAVAEALARMKAQRVVLVYDACKSGAATSGGLSSLGNERQALAVLARAQGIHILTASTDQQMAQEDKALGHGILTYALLAGLGGKAKTEGDNGIMVRELTGYVERSVRQLIDERHLRQQVPMPFNWGQNFALVGAKP